jgi:surface antigen
MALWTGAKEDRLNLSRILASTTALLLVVTAARPSAAANICSETVATNRTIDGIPAYDQCTDSTNSAIYSSNGVDTSTTSAGTGWVRTQWSGGYQCTELAHRYLYFKWNVQNVPNGNAGTWCDGTIPTGLAKSTTPVHGDLIVFAPGSCGADATTGHVAVVDVVNADATVTFVEQNRAGRRKCANSTAACFLHATANNGTPVDGGAAPDAAPDVPSDIPAAQPDASRRPDSIGSPDRAPTGSGGASDTGGAVSTGGSIAVGGTIGTSGSGGASALAGAQGAGGKLGSGGNGGASSQDTTTVNAVGGSATSANPGTPSSGCACRLGSRSPNAGAAIAAIFLAVLVLRRRSRG